MVYPLVHVFLILQLAAVMSEKAASTDAASVAGRDETVAPGPADGAAVADRPWDKTNRKVLINGVWKYDDNKAATKMVNQWLQDRQKKATAGKDTSSSSSTNEQLPLEYERIKKPPKAAWMVVTMKDETMVQPLIDYVNNSNIRNKRGNALVAKRADDGDNDESSGKKRGRDDSDANNNPSSKRQRNAVGAERAQKARRPITVEEIKDRITPLWRLTPEEQLDQKMKDMVKKCSMKIIKELKGKFR